jgi:hypothetical protein
MGGSILMLRTFLILFLGGLLITAAGISLFMIGDMVWRQCLHDDPSQGCGDALFFSVAAPIYGVIIGIGFNFLPLFVASVLAVLGRAFFKRVPLWLVIAILPICVLAFVAQGASGYQHDSDVRPLSERLVVFSGFQALCLLICWWWDRREE